MSNDRQIHCAEDIAYYKRRAAEETQRAQGAITPEAKRAHSDLAAIFSGKAAEAEAALFTETRLSATGLT